MSERQVQDKAREERNSYQREWRAKNKDKVRTINARYWAKRARKREERGKKNEQAAE